MRVFNYVCGLSPAFLDKIRTDGHGRWWQLGRHVWSVELTNALDETFEHRRTTAERVWGAGYASDWITHELVMRLKPAIAERLLTRHWDHLQFSSHFVQAALYIATSTSCALARDAMSQCPDAGEMLKHINLYFGIKTVGHPGVRDLRQLEALVPYLDLISPYDIYSFWECCNERDWLDSRRTHLDGCLQGKWREVAKLDESMFFADLDDEIAKGRNGWADIWFDRYVSQGERLEDIFSRLGVWLRKRKTIPAFEFVAAVIVHAGRHHDLDIFLVDGVEPAQGVEAIFADTKFAVSRRSLV